MSNSPPSAPKAQSPVPAGVTSIMCAFNVSVSKSLVVAVVISGAIAISTANHGRWSTPHQTDDHLRCGLILNFLLAL